MEKIAYIGGMNMKYKKPQITSIGMIQGIVPLAGVGAAAAAAANYAAGIVMSEAFAAGAALGASAALLKTTGGDKFLAGKHPAINN